MAPSASLQNDLTAVYMSSCVSSIRQASSTLTLANSYFASYYEALKELYAQNIFHFRMGRSVYKFSKSIPSVQWHAIRKFHIATVFIAPGYQSSNEHWPPETLERWLLCCSTLQWHQNIQELYVELRIQNFKPSPSGAAENIDEEVILTILQPLREIRARRFLVELNTELSPSLRSRIDAKNYEFVGKQRKYIGIV
jgi:hypothetical protein